METPLSPKAQLIPFGGPGEGSFIEEMTFELNGHSLLQIRQGEDGYLGRDCRNSKAMVT